ncbi:MAG TPA: coenzyme F420-0:L-glutamate ligase [Aggregatilineales bacterium]|nr:coenzyme F420-0:L-glutamate ligase [Aggregatilineales bacterium]
MTQLQLIGVPGIPLIETGDDLAAIIAGALKESGQTLVDGDVVVVTSKIVSKAEGRWVDLATVEPDEEARRIAAEVGKDPREVALILSESAGISRMRRGVLIAEHRLGFVCANAGMDHSNTRADGEWRLLLPENPDRTARELRAALNEHFGVTVAVIISDSHGRPFRMGTVGVAIGAAGLPALWDMRGRPDLFGEALQVTEVGFADEIAAAAGLVQGQAAEGMPVVIVRGLTYPADEEASAADLVRPREMDLYR